ncbi:hypothetical protein QF035_009255 [Streptomyces umbrinus]|uniref:Uncharacterized protein n=1 Tax=Streptomyces umbrinus TaxID=67370 RepID=A0ABU0T7K5_9ACTN|nr:hypothetical protein [Streptomyces umbrinus]MDQ1031673.1 hypothetical protein [Streptomyces umbrinus]
MTVVDPVFQMFPEEGPLRLAAGSPPSAPVAFKVGAAKTGVFLCVIALGSECAPAGEAAPAIELRAGLGKFALVPREPDTVVIRDDSLMRVAKASWIREPRDVFLVRLDISKPSGRLWHMRVTNKASTELLFVWVVSDLEKDTRQPRLLMERSHGRLALPGAPVDDIVVNMANVGTRDLFIDTAAGADLGDGFLLHEVTRTLAPHDCGHLTIKVPPVESIPFGAGQMHHFTDFTLEANTRDEEERTLHLRVSRKLGKEKEKENKEKEGKEGGKDKEQKDQPDELMMAGDLFPTPLAPLVAWTGAASPHVHFIPPELRPDLSTSALVHEDPTP